MSGTFGLTNHNSGFFQTSPARATRFGANSLACSPCRGRGRHQISFHTACPARAEKPQNTQVLSSPVLGTSGLLTTTRWSFRHDDFFADALDSKTTCLKFPLVMIECMFCDGNALAIFLLALRQNKEKA